MSDQLPRCQSHYDPKCWEDLPAKNGTIKTVCKTCGRFVGYRFVTRDDKQPRAEKKQEPKP